MNAPASGVKVRGADSRTLGGQYGWLICTRLTSAVLQAVSLILLARWAGPATFGTTAAVMGVLTVAGVLADLGLGPLLLRERSSDRQTILTGPVLRLNLLTSGVLAVCAVTVLAALSGATSNTTFLFLVPLGVWLAAEKNGDVWLNIATADGRTHLSAVSVVLRRGLGLALFVALSALLPVALAFAVGSAIGSLVANVVMRKQLDPGPRGASAPLQLTVLRAAAPFYLNSIAAHARSLDVAIVSAFSGPVAAAMYAVPARITSPLRMLPTTLNPIIVRYTALGTVDSLRAVKRVSVAVMIVMPLLMFAVVLVAPWLVDIALGRFLLRCRTPVAHHLCRPRVRLRRFAPDQLSPGARRRTLRGSRRCLRNHRNGWRPCTWCRSRRINGCCDRRFEHLLRALHAVGAAYDCPQAGCRMMQQSTIPAFVSCVAQHDNLGDLVIRRTVVQWLAEGGYIPHVLVKGMPDDFVDGLMLEPPTVLYRSRRRWLTALASGATRGRTTALAYTPGPQSLSISAGHVGHAIVNLLLAQLVTRRSGTLLKIGRSIEPRSPSMMALERLLARRSSLYTVRDEESRELLQCPPCRCSTGCRVACGAGIGVGRRHGRALPISDVVSVGPKLRRSGCHRD